MSSTSRCGWWRRRRRAKSWTFPPLPRPASPACPSKALRPWLPPRLWRAPRRGPCRRSTWPRSALCSKPTTPTVMATSRERRRASCSCPIRCPSKVQRGRRGEGWGGGVGCSRSRRPQGHLGSLGHGPRRKAVAHGVCLAAVGWQRTHRCRFFVAMYLILRRKQGDELPATVPASLLKSIEDAADGAFPPPPVRSLLTRAQPRSSPSRRRSWRGSTRCLLKPIRTATAS